MILSGNEILKQVEAGTIRIDPFHPERVNPASFDLTLGNIVKVYEDYINFPGVGSVSDRYDGRWISARQAPLTHDTKHSLKVRSFEMDPELGWILTPGVAYLMHTAENVHTETYVPILDGKSSIARLFIQVHMTAGFGDPGFDGQYTLEVTSQFPVRVYPGMRICQIRFHKIEGQVTSYQRTGNYRGGLAEGPIESRAHISAFK